MTTGSMPSLFDDDDNGAIDPQVVERIAAAVVDRVSQKLVVTVSAQVTQDVTAIVDARLREQQSTTSGLRSTVEEIIEALARQNRQTSAVEADLRTAMDRAVERAAAVGRGEGSPEFAALRERLDDVVHRLEIPPPDLSPIHATLREVHGLVRDDGTLREEFVRLRESIHDVVARATPDLTPLVDRLTDIAASLEGRDRRDVAHQQGVVDALATMDERVADIRIDPAPMVDAVERLRGQLAQSLPDAATVTGVIKATATEASTELSALRDRLDSLASALERQERAASERSAGAEVDHSHIDRLTDAVTTGIRAQQTHLDEIRQAVEAHHTDLAPMLDAVAGAVDTLSGRADDGVERTIGALQRTLEDQLGPLRRETATTTAEIHAIGAVLDLVESAVDQGRSSDDGAALGQLSNEVHQLAEETSADLRHFRELLVPVTEASAAVAEQVRSLGVRLDSRDDTPPVDVSAIETAITEVHRHVESLRTSTDADAATRRDGFAELAAAVDNSRATLAIIRTALDHLPDKLEPTVVDLRPLMTSLAEIDRRIPDPNRLDQSQTRIADRLDLLGEDLAAAIDRVSAAQSSTGDALTARLTAIQRAIEQLREDETLSEAETRLTQRVESNFASLRSRLDDQFLMADSVGANMSQLNAALVKAAEEPHQLRRDLDRTLDQLAEHLGAAMREMRSELHRTADDPVALRSSVEAGLDRISGRFQNDASRILDAVTFAQEDADSRLRRIDAQVNELRRTVDQVRRNADPLGPSDARPQRD